MQPALAVRIRKAIAAVEVLGGAVGVTMVLFLAPELAQAVNASVWLLILSLISAFGLSVIAGILLWRDGSAGHLLALLVLAMQVPVISNPSFGYYFNNGLALRIMLGPQGWSLYAFLGSQIHVSWAEGAAGTTVGVNVVGLVLGALLFAAIPTDVTGGADPNRSVSPEESIARPSATRLGTGE